MTARAQLFVSELFVESVEGLRSVVAAAFGFQRHEELVHERDAGKRQLLLTGGLQHDREVLLLVLDREGRFEVAVDHFLAEHFQSPGVGGARRQRLVEGGERQARLLREREGLRHRHQVDADEDLVGRLAELPGAGGAQMRDPLSHRLEDGTRLLQRRGVASDEEGQCPLVRSFLASGHRRVQERDAALRQPRGDAAGSLRRDRGGVDDDRAGGRAGGRAAFPEMDLFDLRRIGHGGYDDIALAADLGRLPDCPSARDLARERLRFFEVAGHDRERKPGLREVARHSLAHGPKSNEADRLLHQAPRAGDYCIRARTAAPPEATAASPGAGTAAGRGLRAGGGATKTCGAALGATFRKSRRKALQFSRISPARSLPVASRCASIICESSRASGGARAWRPTISGLRRSRKSPLSSRTYATPPAIPAPKLRPQPPRTATRPAVMYSQPWSPSPSTTARAPLFRTAKRSPALPATKRRPPVAP